MVFFEIRSRLGVLELLLRFEYIWSVVAGPPHYVYDACRFGRQNFSGYAQRRDEVRCSLRTLYHCMHSAVSWSRRSRDDDSPVPQLQ